jgi:cytochrome P450
MIPMISNMKLTTSTPIAVRYMRWRVFIRTPTKVDTRSLRQFGRIFVLPDWVPTRDNQGGKQARKMLDEVIMGFIHDRRASGVDKGDLLSMLLMAVDSEGAGGMTDKQARDEAFTLFAAGHETTANTLTWTWYLLSQHPQAEARLHAELDRVLAGRAPTMNDLPNLPYTDRIIKESMRLYPPAWTVARETVAPVTFGEYTIPPGRFIFATQWVSHRDPRFFTDPEQFIPERWEGNFEKSLPRGAYFPFGAGPRICIGNTFALMEARLVMATLAQHYSLKLAPGQVVATRAMITLRPCHGMRMQLVPRV